MFLRPDLERSDFAACGQITAIVIGLEPGLRHPNNLRLLYVCMFHIVHVCPDSDDGSPFGTACEKQKPRGVPRGMWKFRLGLQIDGRFRNAVASTMRMHAKCKSARLGPA